MSDYGDLASMMSGARRSSPYDRKRQLALQMMQAGADYSPVRHPLQGAARLAQALVGGYIANKADTEEKDAREQLAQKIADAGKIKDPQERIAAYTAIDPQIGMRAGATFAVEQAKMAQQGQIRGQQADGWAGGYGLPPGGQPGPIGAGPPLPAGQPNASGFNNNLGNLRVSNANWQGKGSPHNGFETFATPQDGANAMFQNLGAYVKAQPGITVAQAISKWAPPNENDTNLYIRQVMEATGINPAMPLAEVLQDPAVAATLMDAMTRKEKGGLPQGVTADTFMTASTPRGAPTGPPQPLTVNMQGPGGIPQGSADGMPPTQGAPPPPQAPGGMPAVTPPAIPDVPRPQPNPQTIQRLQGMIRSGMMTPQQAEAELRAEVDRDWSVARDRAKMQYEQQSDAYTEGRKPTEAQKAVDSNFGKDYAEWVAGGGQADTRRQIVQLEEVLGKLKSGKNLTGPFVGNLPDAVLNVFNPDAIAARNAVEEVVQRNLRLVLGAQFTEKEGERLIARAYNPSLSEAENAKRVERLLNQIKQAAAAKVSAGQYYEQHGTLRGWSGKLPTLSDFDPDARTDRGNPEDLRKKYRLE